MTTAPWVYEVLFVGNRDHKETEELINQRAAEGWEVVSVDGQRVYLKRRR